MHRAGEGMITLRSSEQQYTGKEQGRKNRREHIFKHPLPTRSLSLVTMHTEPLLAWPLTDWYKHTHACQHFYLDICSGILRMGASEICLPYHWEMSKANADKLSEARQSRTNNVKGPSHPSTHTHTQQDSEYQNSGSLEAISTDSHLHAAPPRLCSAPFLWLNYTWIGVFTEVVG